MNKVKHLLVFFLCCLIFYRIGLYIYKAPAVRPDYAKLKNAWLHSQYNLNQGYEFYGNMTDEDLYTFAALEYLKGGDPSVVCFEVPPLGKYLFALSHLAFGNMLISQMVFSLGSLLLIYLLGRQLGLPMIYRLLAVLLFTLEPLNIEFSSFVNVDMMHNFFIYLAVLLLTKQRLNSSWSVVLGLSIGGVLATKAFFNGLILLAFSLVILYLKQEKKAAVKSILIAVSAFAVYLLSYTVFFFYHKPFDFLLFQVRVLRFYRSYLPEYPWFEIWRILLVGYWRTWFGSPLFQKVAEYWPGWTVSGLIMLYLSLKRKSWQIPFRSASIYLGWVVLYLVYSSVHLVFPKYLQPVLPFLYLLSLQQIYFFSRRKFSRLHKYHSKLITLL